MAARAVVAGRRAGAVRALAGLAAFLLGTSAAPQGVAAALADAGRPTCRGLEATIVGIRGEWLRGTPGDDVAVTNGASVVLTKGGDDTICVTPGTSGTPRSMGIFPGRGDDVVDSTAMPAASQVSTDLGEGVDLAVGGPARERVDTCRGRVADTVSTGGGNDWVRLCGKPSPDVVDTGDGDDTYLILEPADAHGPVVAGPGSNTLVLVGPDQVPADTWVIDLADRSSTVDGSRMFGWDNVSELLVIDPGVALTVKGTEARDNVDISGFLADSPPLSVVVELLAGDDRLGIEREVLGPGSRIDAGAGRDLLRALSFGALEIDLHDGAMSDASGDSTAAVQQVEDIRAHGQTVRVTGDQGDNQLRARGCDVVVRGRDGADRIRLAPLPRRSFGCSTGRLRGDGDRGDDVLVGGSDADELVGGSGVDQADGGGGFDVCAAERRVRCERRPRTHVPTDRSAS